MNELRNKNQNIKNTNYITRQWC